MDEYKIIIENQILTATAGHDHFALEVGPEQRPCLIRNCTIDGSLGDWGLKSSMSFDLVVEDCIIRNGIERALDMVRGGNVTFRRCTFINDGKRPRVTSKWQVQKECDIGLKAGMRDITFEDCTMNDLLLGDYSIYDQIDRPRVRRIRLINCKNMNGGPIIVRGRYCVTHPILATNTDYDMLVWPKWIVAIYWWYNRKFGDTRKLTPEQAIIAPEEMI